MTALLLHSRTDRCDPYIGYFIGSTMTNIIEVVPDGDEFFIRFQTPKVIYFLSKNGWSVWWDDRIVITLNGLCGN